ncbi:MAG: HPr family phosphocarrier protein [bacterium]
MNSVEKIVTLENKLGLHLRAAVIFVQAATKFQSVIKVKKVNNSGSGWRNGKSILSVGTLDAGKGSQIIINARGEDAIEAVEKLTKLFEDKFGEKE